jgi:hypothetical protein
VNITGFYQEWRARYRAHLDTDADDRFYNELYIMLEVIEADDGDRPTSPFRHSASIW